MFHVSRTARFSCVSSCIAILTGCGGKNTTPSTPAPPTTLTSTLTLGPGQTSAGGLLKSLFVGQSLPAAGYSFVCTLHSSNAQMNFNATPSSSWFTVSPASGALAANGSTAIGLGSVDARALPNASNSGLVTISAAGYTDNSGMSITLNCSQINSQGQPTCTLTIACQ